MSQINYLSEERLPTPSANARSTVSTYYAFVFLEVTS